MRALIGLLLAANLAMAVIAFKPFGGSADDLRQDQARLSAQLRQLRTTLEKSKEHVAKIEIARTQGDDFMAKYIMDKRDAAAIMVEEMNKAATDAGIRSLPDTFAYEEIEGSDTLQMMSIGAPFEGDYAGLAKMVNLLEKSQPVLDYRRDELECAAAAEPEGRLAAAESQREFEAAGVRPRRFGDCRMKIGAENKKSVYALTVLGLVAAYMVYSNFFSGPSYKPVTPPAARPDVPDTAGTAVPAPEKSSGPDISQAKGKVGRGTSSKAKNNGEFHPIFLAKKKEDRVERQHCRSHHSLRSAGKGDEGAAGRR